MTTEELKEELDKYPSNTIVTMDYGGTIKNNINIDYYKDSNEICIY